MDVHLCESRQPLTLRYYSSSLLHERGGLCCLLSNAVNVDVVFPQREVGEGGELCGQCCREQERLPGCGARKRLQELRYLHKCIANVTCMYVNICVCLSDVLECSPSSINK
jgi:hypothetical protein